MTSPTWWRDLATASSAGTAKAAVPANATRTGVWSGADQLGYLFLRLGFDLAQSFQAGQAVCEQDPVEVIDLVLDGAREQSIAFDPDRLALAVEAAGDHAHGALDLAHIARHRETALHADLLPLPLDHLGVDQHVQVLVRLEDDHPQPDSNLGRRQSHARRGDHGLDHVVDQLADAVIDAADPLRLLAKDRRFLGQDREYGHANSYIGSTSRLQPRPRGRPSATRCSTGP